MELEQQVASLELAKKLKELGVKQESYFYHWKANAGNRGEAWEISTYRPSKDTGEGECYSAYTVAELGEMLPSDKLRQIHKSPAYGWTRSTRPDEHPAYRGVDHTDTEADARAKMLIYLIENNLCSPK